MYSIKDKYHFKNYIRKICFDLGISKASFEENVTQVLFEIYEFEEVNSDFFSQYDFEITQYIVNKFSQLDNLNQAFDLLHGNYLNELNEELKEVSYLINKHPDYLKRNMFINDSNSSYIINVNKYSLLYGISISQNKFIGAYRGDTELTMEFMHFINILEKKIGIYFIYDSERKLKYIGKSINLGRRIIEILREKEGEYVSVILTKTRENMHLYKDYYILKEKPYINVKYPETANLSFWKRKFKRTKVIPVYKNYTNESKSNNIKSLYLKLFKRK